MGTAPGQVRLGGCTVDLINRRVHAGGARSVGLGPRDADLLAYLLRHRGQVLPRDQVMGAVWGVRSRSSRALDMAVRRLRVLVEHDPAEPRFLRTVHGIGYRLDLGDATAERGMPLPLSVDAFVGRQAELQRLSQLDTPFALLVGPPGVGKSRLALEHAQLVRGRYTGVWWCELAQADDEASICAVVARILGVELRGDPALQLGEVFAHRGRALVLLDNLEHLHDPVVRLLGRWLGRAPQLRVVGTSREVVGIGEVEVEVAPLPSEQGAALFASRAGERVQADDPRVTTLVAHTCGVPLAIEIAAARLRGLSLDDLNARLEEGLAVLRGPATHAARHTSVLHALTWSWDLLTAHEQRALARLSVFRGGVSLAAAEAVIGAREGPAADLLVQSLVERHLVTRVDRSGAARFDLLELVRRFAADQLAGLGGAPDAEALHGRWAARVGRGDRAVAGGSVGEQVDALARGRALDLDEADLERANLTAALERACRAGEVEVAAAVAETLWWSCERTGPLESGIAALERALSVTTADPWRTHLELLLGEAVEAGGKPARARTHLEAALASAVALGCRGTRARVLTALARLDWLDGRGEQAQMRLEAALSQHRSDGHPQSEARVLRELANLLRQQGRGDEAEACCRAALSLVRAIGDRGEECLVLHAYGEVDRLRGRTGEARARYEEALTAQRALGNRRAEGALLVALAMLCGQGGDLGRAEELYGAALVIAREVGDVRLEAQVLGNLASTLRRTRGHTVEVRSLLEAAVDGMRRLGDQRNEAAAHNNLGLFLRESGAPDLARTHFEVARDAARACGARVIEGHAIGNLAGLHADAARWDEAVEGLERALVVVRGVGDRRGEAVHLGGLGLANLQRGEEAAATAQFEAALALHREVGNQHGESLVLCLLGSVRARTGDGSAAEAAYLSAQGLAQSCGYRLEEARALSHLSELALDRGAAARARLLAEEALALVLADAPRRVVGALRVTLARCAVALGALDEAESLLQAAELDGGIRSDLAKAVCVRAELAVAKGGSAAEIVARARREVSALGLERDPAIGRALARVEAQAARDGR